MVNLVTRVIAWLAVLMVGSFLCVHLPQAVLAALGTFAVGAASVAFATFLLQGGKWR